MRVLAVLVLLTVPAAVGAAPRDCATTATKALVACVTRATAAFRACTSKGRESCADDPAASRAGIRLRRKVIVACPEDALRDAGHPPPFVPEVFAVRLDATCRAAASAFVAGSDDALGSGSSRRCRAALGGASARVGVGTLATTGACALAGDGCRADRTAKRLTTIATKARRAATRGCGAPVEATVSGVLDRTRAQTGCVLAQALPAFATCAPSGAEALVDLWRLPVTHPGGTRAAQVSSYDRTGGNADLGIGPDTAPLLANLGLPAVELDFSYLYRDGDRFVVFDEIGPGVVWRIWMTGLDGLFAGGLGGDVAFELDGETVPRLQLTRTALFGGTTAPFLAPLAGNSAVSSGGFYSALPIAFARRLRITTSTVPNWLQISFTRFPPDQVVGSFDPTIDQSVVAAQLAQAGDPSTTREPTVTEEIPLAVAPGAAQAVWSRTKAGTIVRLELLAPGGADVPTDLRLRATFDAAATPQVDAPLDDVFGASLGAGAHGMAFGRAGDRFYCYFPMPFRESAQLELRNDGAATFDGWRLRVGVVDALPPGHRRRTSMHRLPRRISCPTGPTSSSSSAPARGTSSAS